MKRYDEAVNTLYKAFNEDTLDAFNCEACAIGSLVGEKECRFWSMHAYDLFKGIESLKNRSVYNPPKHKDYSEEELFNIEEIFLTEWEKNRSNDGEDKVIQFNGLMAVIGYLAELDNIESIETQYKQFVEVLNRKELTLN